MHLIIGRNADREAQVFLSGFLEESLGLVDVTIVDIGEFIIEVFLQAGDDRSSCLGAQTVADSLDDLVGIYRVGHCLAHAHILEGAELVVESQQLDSVGMADVLNIIGTLEFLPAACI